MTHAEETEAQEKELDKILKKAKDICLSIDIIGKNTSIDGYYIQFGFSPLKKKCYKCGQVIE